MTIDLSGAVEAVEALMIDRAVITRDEQGVADDRLDEVTGLLVPPTPDAGPLYAGRAMFGPPQHLQEADPAGLAVAPLERNDRRVLIPLSAPPVRPGDRVRCEKAARDRQLVGQTFVVIDEGETSTYAVARSVYVRPEAPA